MTSGVLAAVVAEMELQDRREEAAARKRKAQLVQQHEEGRVPRSPAESLQWAHAAVEGRTPHTHQDVLRQAAVAEQKADRDARKGRHPKGCGCEKCIVSKLGVMVPGYDWQP